jgi:hypothetical protein
MTRLTRFWIEKNECRLVQPERNSRFHVTREISLETQSLESSSGDQMKIN